MSCQLQGKVYRSRLKYAMAATRALIDDSNRLIRPLLNISRPIGIAACWFSAEEWTEYDPGSGTYTCRYGYGSR